MTTVDRRAYRLVPAAAAAWLTASITTVHPDASPLSCGVLWACALVAVVVLLSVPMRRGRTTLAVIAVSIVFAAVAASSVASAAPGRSAAAAMTGERALEVVVVVTGKAAGTVRGLRADAVAEEIRAGQTRLAAGVPVTLLIEEPVAGLDVGARVRSDATAFPAEPGERAVLVVRLRADGLVVEPPEGVLAGAAWLRTSLGAATSGLARPGADLIPGLAVGDTAQVDDDLDQTMKATSLSHLTAVSGANCAIVVGLAFLLAAACGAPRAGRVAAGMAALVGFVVLVTPEPSVVRAATMAAIAMGALLLGRRGAGLAVLSLAVGILLAVDPWLSSSLGFALSAAATAALLVLAPPIGRGLARFLPRPLALAIAVPVSAQLVCGPLIVLISPGVSVYGVVANLLAAPAAPAATVLGLLACVAAPLPWLQSGLVVLAWLPAAWIAATAETVAALPGNTLPWPEGLPGLMALAAAGAVVLVLLVPPGRRRIGRAVRAMSAVAAMAGGGVLVGSVVVTSVVVPLTTPRDWVIAMCDVGQGDAVLIRSEGRVMLLDTGAAPAPTAECLTRLDVERLDILVLTHFDLDHVGGVDAVAGRVDLLLHGPPGDARDERDVDRVRAERTREATAGMTGTLGAASWRVLWPSGSAFPPGNDASVVLEVAGAGVPRTVLLGDLGAGAQRALLATGALRPPYRVVKLAHHGSADQERALYAALGAEVALIPVGGENGYGHPRAEVFDMLRATGTVSARSDQDGLVLVALVPHEGDERLALWRERAPPDVGGAG
ncbi:ComEC/Rec2 family competence protein [Microbacterium sp. 18062]|uniref:ComEC/Rec2 family competence protein n=1 Tax=Microbacterium sp. 18062 TaxID=2681410 RepID=UPI0013592B0A|nr:ComEC/Rec2 family competence protein [Microbacterium sp. 18062]